MTRRVIGASIGVWLLMSFSLWASGWDPAVFALGGILVAGGVAIFVVVDLVAGTRPAVWPDRGNGVEHGGGRQHEWAQVQAGDLYRSDWTDTTQIRETLLGVMDERLASEYGVDRQADPAAADDVLPPRLRRLAAGPSPRLTSVTEIRSILSEIEEL